ncbi:MAG: hypothetical protein ACRDHE_14795 [Ktedonobacterales bacterium]
MYLQDTDNGLNTGDQCYGPAADSTSAEAIVERNLNYSYFVDFSSITFLGVGISDNGNYLPMKQAPNDYYETADCLNQKGYNCLQWSVPYDTVGPIVYDAGDTPYDEYAINWKIYTTS